MKLTVKKKEVTCIIRKWNETFLLEQKSLSNFFGFIEDFHIDLTDILIYFFCARSRSTSFMLAQADLFFFLYLFILVTEPKIEQFYF